MVNTLKKEIEHSKDEYTNYESELRNELVTKWSKRVKETEDYYE